MRQLGRPRLLLHRSFRPALILSKIVVDVGNPACDGLVAAGDTQMPLTKSQLFHHVHAICRGKNVAYFGGYQKAFGHYLRICTAEKLCYGWNV
jgi:hypothetical protein